MKIILRASLMSVFQQFEGDQHRKNRQTWY
jgi:hypothetical protein